MQLHFVALLVLCISFKNLLPWCWDKNGWLWFCSILQVARLACTIKLFNLGNFVIYGFVPISYEIASCVCQLSKTFFGVGIVPSSIDSFVHTPWSVRYVPVFWGRCFGSLYKNIQHLFCIPESFGTVGVSIRMLIDSTKNHLVCEVGLRLIHCKRNGITSPTQILQGCC